MSGMENCREETVLMIFASADSYLIHCMTTIRSSPDDPRSNFLSP